MVSAWSACYSSLQSSGIVSIATALTFRFRLIVFVLSLVIPPLKPGLWIFPNLFADVGVLDSFIPLYGWSGVNYERMHLEKYKKQAARKNKKKSRKSKKDDETTPGQVSTEQE